MERDLADARGVLSGTFASVIPKATPGGVLPDYDPFKGMSKITIVDPIEKTAFEVDLSRLPSKEQMASLIEKYGLHNDAQDIDDRRASIQAVYKELASLTQPEPISNNGNRFAGTRPVSPIEPSRTAVDSKPFVLTHTDASPTSSQPVASLPPGHMAGAGPAMETVSLFAKVSGQAHAPEPIKPPTVKVTFEARNAPGRMEAFYHYVVRQDELLVLIFDRRAVGFPRFHPQKSDEDIAIQIGNEPTIYIARAFGLNYAFQDYDHHILIIREEHPIQP